MGKLERVGMRSGDDHRRADMGQREQFLREFERQTHAAMGGRVAWKIAGVQRNALPCQPVHVRHWRVVIGRRPVILVLLENRENAGRRFVAGFAGRAGRHRNANAVAVDMNPLLGKRNDDRHRPLRRALGMPGIFTGFKLADFLYHLSGKTELRCKQQRRACCTDEQRTPGERAFDRWQCRSSHAFLRSSIGTPHLTQVWCGCGGQSRYAAATMRRLRRAIETEER